MVGDRKKYYISLQAGQYAAGGGPSISYPAQASQPSCFEHVVRRVLDRLAAER
jgi:hypothetical protein